MKRKNKILVTMKALTLAAAVATMLVSPSCRKETVGGAAGNVADGVRVITVQFDNSTKASLNGVKPTFTNNDKIRVSNSEKSEECTVTVSGPSAKFTTTLSGELTAIYPADAAVLDSEETDAPIASSNNFKVPAIQTGLVKDAIIAKATIAGNIATFTSVTALFEITPPSTAKIITVTSLEKVESGSRTGTAADINTEDTGKTAITVGDGSADLPGTIYVAFKPGVKLTDLSFDAGEDIGLKGIPTSKLGTRPDETAANAKYTIDWTNWHPYVTIGGKKWATENIGATDTDPWGVYFAWGGITGYALQENPIDNPYDFIHFVDDHNFSWVNCPFWDEFSSEFTKYFSGDTKTVLDLADDAANANWGGPWRMPTGGPSGEFQALHTAAPCSWTTESSVNGFKFIEISTSKTLFFPAVGYGESIVLNDFGTRGYYWSSSLDTGNKVNAHSLLFSEYDDYEDFCDVRYRGKPVRPVADLGGFVFGTYTDNGEF